MLKTLVGNRKCLGFTIVVFLALAAWFWAKPADESKVVFDGYRWGIHVSTLEITDDGDNVTYRLRTKDIQKNQWVPATTVSAAGAFDPADGLKEFPTAYAALSQINWDGPKAIGWPDENHLYVRHREMVKEVQGNKVHASYWGVKDKTDPLDLVIGADNSIIAAVDIHRDHVMVRRGFEAFTVVEKWRNPSVSQPLYGYSALPQHMMEAKDGVKLATRVFLPEGDIEGPFPTIFIRTPYGISELISRYEHYAVRGFAVVLQAVRGTAYWDPEALSEGELEMMVNEASDGADALNWITEQPWSDGSICMQGASYVGFTQWAATMAGNPALKCIIPESSMGTAFSDQPYMGGTYVEGGAYYALWMKNKELLPGRTWPEILRHRPLTDLDEFATGVDIPTWNDDISRLSSDRHWERQDWLAGDHPRTVASFQISGWFDDDYPGTRSAWAMMQKRGTLPNRLLLGPWRHSYNHDRKLNGYSFGIDALRDDIWLLKQKWYDHFLKGVNNGVTGTGVEYFVLGTNEWRMAEAWPPKNAENKKWYFSSTGKANLHADDGKLKATPPADAETPETYVYDPENAPRNWYSFDLMESWSDVQSYPYDFKDTETRSDVVTFTSAPLEADVTVAGNIKVVLYASTDVKDTDWWVYLSHVKPDNSSNRLSVGALRARFRNLDDPDYHAFGSNFKTEELLSGNIEDVVRYEISIPSIANRFSKGDRIRIAVMNAMENYSFPNSNTGGDESRVSTTIPGTMRIHHSDKHPSHVVMSVLPD